MVNAIIGVDVITNAVARNHQIAGCAFSSASSSKRSVPVFSSLGKLREKQQKLALSMAPWPPPMRRYSTKTPRDRNPTQ